MSDYQRGFAIGMAMVQTRFHGIKNSNFDFYMDSPGYLNDEAADGFGDALADYRREKNVVREEGGRWVSRIDNKFVTVSPF